MTQNETERKALVIIDLQKGIASMNTSPHPASEVLENAGRLARKCREKNIPVVAVRVTGPMDIMLHPKVDGNASSFSRGERSADWDQYVDQLGIENGDILITKHQWGAFYGTDLDLQLRRRKIDTIILCGIATTYGVESTARFAYEYGYNQIFVEDAMSDMSAEAHEASLKFVLSRMGIIRKTDEAIKMLD
ncbi:MAG: hydrolase [Thermoplasmataceae archaeon]|jgi:nicotinamidase-related amidase